MTVAVGFSPRFCIQVSQRRGATLDARASPACRIQASLRDGKSNASLRGLKPTATITSSLREAGVFAHSHESDLHQP
jgi:hypothetical protein